ncbi:MAG TPA: hypothetical protein PLD88_06620, partial [Candidatus Berkiella sp.]|nr:hypothetical protein [Candidatus Berkiella sp.]
VQPVLAKYIVPQFGGSSFVWITSLLFFQAALLLGYFYAYLLTKFFSERNQAIIHFIVILISFYFIPIHLQPNLSIESIWPPLAVLSILTSSILLPFMVLSASSPLLQHWYCTLKQTPYPYFYYSISNAGSLLGLLGYPLFLEPFIGTQKQSILCSVIYTFYAILCALCLYQLRSSNTKRLLETKQSITTSYVSLAKWLILAFLTSALLLSTTQFLTQNVINVPLIWILPLAIYLISFITTFATPKGYEREFWFPIFAVFTLLILKNIYFLTLNGIQIVIFLLGLLYTACIICHGELVRAKPEQKDLTLFYLYIALGSVLGGLFANGLSLLFDNWWNLYIPLIIINLIILFISYSMYRQSRKMKERLISLFCLIALLLFLLVIWVDTFPKDKKLIMQHRNLYGLLRIYDMQTESGPYRMLLHGTVMHGSEYLEPDKQLWPTTYYGPHSGAGLAIQYMSKMRDSSLQIAIVGLGTGTIASLANPKDEITFYEIDPDVA